MGKHTKDAYILCMQAPCEGDNAITDYKYEVQAYKSKLIQSLVYVDQLKSLLNPLGKAHKIVSDFLYDDELNEMIGVKEMLEAQKKVVENQNDRPRI